MYLWDVVGHDTSEGSLRSGLGDDLAAIMRSIEPLLVQRVGFAARVVEVTERMSVFHLDAIHVPTGREWLGRRDRNGGVYWEARSCAPDPDTAYRLAAHNGSDSIAS